MSEELKENMCRMIFNCTADDINDCATSKQSGSWGCEYLKYDICHSSVARVNAMVIEMKRLGFVATNETQKSLLKDIRALLQKSLDSGFGLRPVELAVELIDSVLD